MFIRCHTSFAVNVWRHFDHVALKSGLKSSLKCLQWRNSFMEPHKWRHFKAKSWERYQSTISTQICTSLFSVIVEITVKPCRTVYTSTLHSMYWHNYSFQFVSFNAGQFWDLLTCVRYPRCLCCLFCLSIVFNVEILSRETQDFSLIPNEVFFDVLKTSCTLPRCRNGPGSHWLGSNATLPRSLTSAFAEISKTSPGHLDSVFACRPPSWIAW